MTEVFECALLLIMMYAVLELGPVGDGIRAAIKQVGLLRSHSCELELLLADIRLAGPISVPASELCFQNAVWAISLSRRLKAGY